MLTSETWTIYEGERTLIQFFEGQCFRLGHEEEDEEEPDHVPTRVPSECTLRLERTEETRERDGDDEVEEPKDGRRERHAYITDIEGISLSGVLGTRRSIR